MLSGPQIPVAVLMTMTFAYVAQFYLFRADGTRSTVLRQRLGGALFLGGLPLLVTAALLPGHPVDYGLALGDAAVGAPAVGGLALLLGPILFVAAGRPMQLAVYPQIRLPVGAWDGRLIAESVAAWAIYLLAYEWLFRGFVLFPLVAAFGLGPGMAVMVAMYVLVHLDKAPTEALGCFPMGVVFGMLAVETGGIFWPWVLHTGIAVGTELAALRAMRQRDRA